jgi:glycosyltransferase involved in cell wall biosynthesis
MDASQFFIVVPFYNEELRIADTLQALHAQSDPDFSLVLVDNRSTDRSREVVDRFDQQHRFKRLVVVDEPEKGTGVAADTGFRYAIGQGAVYIARTDADCLPEARWVEKLKRAFAEERLEFIIGKIAPREDDLPYTRSDRLMVPILVTVAENFGKLFRHGRQFKYPYVMVAGNNLAITADLYERAGGFPRSRTELIFEDLALAERIRQITSRVKKHNDIVVYNSTRRMKKYGYLRILFWYWGHKYKPAVVDVR